MVLLVEGYAYPPELEAIIAAGGDAVRRVGDLAEAVAVLTAGGARAALIGARVFSHKDHLSFRLSRAMAPGAALVVVTTEPAPWPELKHALESGATTFLRWPAPPDVVQQALRSASSHGPGWGPGT